MKLNETMTTGTVKVCVMINDQGSYVIGGSPDECAEAWAELEPYEPTLALATYELAIEFPLPTVQRADANVAPAGGPVQLRLVK